MDKEGLQESDGHNSVMDAYSVVVSRLKLDWRIGGQVDSGARTTRIRLATLPAYVIRNTVLAG
jgi:hypothetical protein